MNHQHQHILRCFTIVKIGRWHHLKHFSLHSAGVFWLLQNLLLPQGRKNLTHETLPIIMAVINIITCLSAFCFFLCLMYSEVHYSELIHCKFTIMSLWIFVKAMVFWFCVYRNRRRNQCIAAQKLNSKILFFLFPFLRLPTLEA